MVNFVEYDDEEPELTGDPAALRLPGQSRRSALAMWVGFCVHSGVWQFLCIMALALLLYPVAMVLLYIRFGG